VVVRYEIRTNGSTTATLRCAVNPVQPGTAATVNVRQVVRANVRKRRRTGRVWCFAERRRATAVNRSPMANCILSEAVGRHLVRVTAGSRRPG